MKSVLKSLLRRIWNARLYPGFRDKVTRMVVDYLQEASVLVSVLGILDSIIAWRQEPSFKVVGWSLGIAVGVFAVAVILQAVNEPDSLEASLGGSTSNSEGEENDA